MEYGYSTALEATSDRRMTPLDDDPKDRSVGVRGLQHFSPKLGRFRLTRQIRRAHIYRSRLPSVCLFTDNILAVNYREPRGNSEVTQSSEANSEGVSEEAIRVTEWQSPIGA